jgi:hypothetical protein
MGDIVSTQKDLLEDWHGPLVLAWKRPSDYAASYIVFDPEALMISKAFENDRFGVRMINFSIQLGHNWKIEESLTDVWQRLKKSRSAKLDAFCQKYRGPPPC